MRCRGLALLSFLLLSGLTAYLPGFAQQQSTTASASETDAVRLSRLIDESSLTFRSRRKHRATRWVSLHKLSPTSWAAMRCYVCAQELKKSWGRTLTSASFMTGSWAVARCLWKFLSSMWNGASSRQRIARPQFIDRKHAYRKPTFSLWVAKTLLKFT